MNLESIREAVQGLEATEGIRKRVESSLEELTKNDQQTEYALKDTLNQLFRLEAGERDNREGLWRRLFEGVDSEYLFVLGESGWPAGERPWTH